MEIKFRTWVERYQEFKIWGFIGEHFVGPPTGSGLSIEECREKSQAYTGLKDKNLVEIYQGDIVKYILKSEHQSKFLRGDESVEYTEVVTWEDGGFCVDGFVPLSATIEWEVEVVGNIIQNPNFFNGN